MEILFIQISFLTVGSKQKNKNENTEYHRIFIHFKGQVYSRQGIPIFLLLESWSLVLYLRVWVKSKFFSFEVQCLGENVIWCISCCSSLLYYNVSFTAESRWFSMVQQFLSPVPIVRSTIHLIRNFTSFQITYYLTTRET